jgi:hypothetical protein
MLLSDLVLLIVQHWIRWQLVALPFKDTALYEGKQVFY